MKDIVQVTRDGFRYRVTFTLTNAWEVRRLAGFLKEAAEQPHCTSREADRWRRAGRTLEKNLAETVWSRFAYTPRVVRPPDEESNDADCDRVVHGPPPYPVLTHADVLRVLPRLEFLRLTVRQIADRLHVSQGSVYRLRRKLREKEERNDDRETPRVR